jgi:ribokinase
VTHEVVVVGDLLVDILVRPDGPVADGSDTPSTTTVSGGGSAANTACWLASLGRTVGLVAALGSDPFGDQAVDELRSTGVELLHDRLPGHPTGTCVVLVAGGERTMFPDRGANDVLEPAAVVAALAEAPRWVHVSGYTLLGSGSRAAGVAAVDRARALGVPWSVDASSAGPLRTAGAGAFLDRVDGCTVLFANDDEVAALGGAVAVRRRVGALVVKHGAAGASWWEADTDLARAASEVDVVDGVGAGDAFDAGCIAARLDGGAPADALAAGAALAARCLARRGARPQLSA